MLNKQIKDKLKQQEKMLRVHNSIDKKWDNGVVCRYTNPVLTSEHIPIHWRYDLDSVTNPLGLERVGVNAVFNAGAIFYEGKYVLIARVEGLDRKSYFAIARSLHPTEGFVFDESPISIPQNEEEDVNVYDMRLTKHEDGYIYGIFCTERKDPNSPIEDTSSAYAKAGIIRTKDLIYWERLPDLKSNTDQQRNVVLHPEFVDHKYLLYTRPQEGFIDVGSKGGISFGYVEDMENPILWNESVMHCKEYHTIYEYKNGLGPAPIKTHKGWLHLAHGVRNTAAGLRYVLYLFMTDLKDTTKIKHLPGGYFMSPWQDERVGDVSNVLFSNGWICREDGSVYIYYASSDTRMHVAKSSIDCLIDYVENTPEDLLKSHKSVETIQQLIEKNREIWELWKKGKKS